MPALRRADKSNDVSAYPFTAKIYYFHPFQAGAKESWPAHFRRIRQMGFDQVLTPPLFATGASGDLFLGANLERANLKLGGGRQADEAIARLSEECGGYGLSLMLDLVVGRVALEADLTTLSPNWFRAAEANADQVDPRLSFRQPDAAYIRFDDQAVAKEVTAWWVERLHRLTNAGVVGFRCLAPQLAPPRVWRQLIAAVRERSPECRFLAWTPGMNWREIARLRDVGFSSVFSSLPWWDGRASWFVEEHELLRTVGSIIACPEAPFGPRLARRYENVTSLPPVYRHVLRRAAATGNGLLVPMGFEFASDEDLQTRPPANDDFALTQLNGNIDLSSEIREANRLIDDIGGLNGEIRNLGQCDGPVNVLLRSDSADVRQSKKPLVILANTDLESEHAVPISLDPLPPAGGASLTNGESILSDGNADSIMAAGEIRIIRMQRNASIDVPPSDRTAARLMTGSRIAIEDISPAVDGGRFAAKRVIGEDVNIEADVFADGHGVLLVELLWRAVDKREWRREPMRALGNDRWLATILPERVGRYEFTIEAGIDKYGTFVRGLEIKMATGADIAIEIAEGKQLLEHAKRRMDEDQMPIIESALVWLSEQKPDAAILVAPDLRELMREVDEQQFTHRHEPVLRLEVERPQAAFGAWYEMFPRSASESPGRHGTFADVTRRLPAIRDMGFDVLYLPPIHPIGTTNRKGKNNALKASAGDVGSPYAIGSSEGGHDAIHPALGTMEDFRHLRMAAADHGLEIALDFAIQYSPDHPWLKDHPEWFNRRPDGSIRYAENPPKRYEDIVNVDFYAIGAIPNLWIALRDIVLFWVGEGVTIFRVDNPHTKPLPFWEWLIDQIRSSHPEVIFLSEAFTRPKIMYRLAKLGFSQSYTYFTWRNTKQELVDYFTELTTSQVKEFFRPHLFVNTPDINPYFLQTSGRPGFLIRAALAATLSGLWGMYSGFEICEAAPLPGREEYSDSEKYEIRPRRYDAAGNIVDEISKLNRIRKSHAALQSNFGLRFYPAHSDQVILYGKPSPTRGELVLVAVNLDPFNVQDITIEVPLWEWSLPDNGSANVQDLISESNFIWHGKFQRVRLDPTVLPFHIWRLSPRFEG